MKYYINQSMNTGGVEMCGPFTTREDAFNQQRLMIAMCQMKAIEEDVLYSIVGNTISFSNGKTIHFSIFEEREYATGVV